MHVISELINDVPVKNRKPNKVHSPYMSTRKLSPPQEKTKISACGYFILNLFNQCAGEWLSTQFIHQEYQKFKNVVVSVDLIKISIYSLRQAGYDIETYSYVGYRLKGQGGQSSSS